MANNKITTQLRRRSHNKCTINEHVKSIQQQWVWIKMKAKNFEQTSSSSRREAVITPNLGIVELRIANVTSSAPKTTPIHFFFVGGRHRSKFGWHQSTLSIKATVKSRLVHLLTQITHSASHWRAITWSGGAGTLPALKKSGPTASRGNIWVRRSMLPFFCFCCSGIRGIYIHPFLWL